MSLQQPPLSVSAIASRLWVACFALLLALLPVASYGKTAAIQGTSGLVKQLDSLATLHDNQVRIGLSKEDRTDRAPTNVDPPDLVNFASSLALPEHLLWAISSASNYAEPDVRVKAYLLPQLRAPPSV